MIATTIAIIYSLSILLVGLSLVIREYGVPTSISHIYYLVPINLQWLFSVWLLAFSFPIVLITDSHAIQLAVGLVALVAVSANFKGDKAINAVHYIGAFGSAGLILLYGLLYTNFHFLSIFTMIVSAFLVILRNKQQGAFWAELLVIGLLYTILLCQ